MKQMTVLLLSTLGVTIARECNETEFHNKLKKCPEISLTSINWVKTIGQHCSAIECSLACLESATEAECTPPGTFRTVDTEAYRVLARYICDGHEDVREAFVDCDSSQQSHSCYTDKQAAFRSLPRDVELYISGYCSAINVYRSCVKETPLEGLHNCTASQKILLTNIFDIITSAEPCNVQHESQLFTEYGGSSDCHSSSSITIKANVSLIYLSYALVIFSISK